MTKEITNSDDVIDSRDIIERIEELEDRKTEWAVGWNMPGYMPDSEPCAFATFDDAKAYLCAVLERFCDETDSIEDGDQYFRAACAVGELETEQDWGQTVNDYHFWISRDPQTNLDDDEAKELEALKALAEEAEDYSEDWQHGSTLIRDDYFVDYAREMLEDCGDIPKNIPSYIEIDWKQTARNIRVDYTSVDFDGVTYWIR